MDATKVLREIGTGLVNLASDRGLADAIAKLAETHPDRRTIAQAVIPGIIEAIVKQAQTTEEQPVILSAEIDEPLMIGGEEFAPLYPDNEEIIKHHLPDNWELEYDSIYYCQMSDGNVLVYHKKSSLLSFRGTLCFVEAFEDEVLISCADWPDFNSIAEMIEALS